MQVMFSSVLTTQSQYPKREWKIPELNHWLKEWCHKVNFGFIDHGLHYLQEGIGWIIPHKNREEYVWNIIDSAYPKGFKTGRGERQIITVRNISPKITNQTTKNGVVRRKGNSGIKQEK